MKKNHWHTRYLQDAQLHASYSKDRKHKVGAILYDPATHVTLMKGFNGIPRGIDDTVDTLNEPPLKAFVFEHAERNVIYHAARYGLKTAGLGIATTRYPCADCARAIISCGLTEMVTVEPNWDHPTWGRHFETARKMLSTVEIPVHLVAPEQRGTLIELDSSKYPVKPRVRGISL